MYVQRNNEARSCNHCCSEKPINITYAECVFEALGMKYIIHIRHNFIYGLSGCTIISTLSHKRHDFGRKKYIGHEVSILIFSAKFVLNTPHSKKK
jgi:hypothetical protein